MPVSAMRALGLGHRRERCTVRPECRTWFESAVLRTATDFLALPGVVSVGMSAETCRASRLTG